MGDGGFALLFLGFCMVFAAFIIVSVRIYQINPDIMRRFVKYLIICIIALLFSIASIIIGNRIDSRHKGTYSRNLKSVQEIWGGRINQQSPVFSYKKSELTDYTDDKTGQLKQKTVVSSVAMGFSRQKISLKIDANIRTKGLLKFAGYQLRFDSEFIVENTRTVVDTFQFIFHLPEKAGNITEIAVLMDGIEYRGDSNFGDGIEWSGLLKPGEKRTFIIRYTAQGTGRFQYSLGTNKVAIARLICELNTDFTNITIPEHAMVPAKQHSDSARTRMNWKSDNLVSGQNIAVKFTIPGNYGEIAAKLFYYSPLAFFLFIGVLLLYTIGAAIRLHPMHFIFLLGSFFIFYLLGSYLLSFFPAIAAILLSLAISSGILMYYAVLIKKGTALVKTVGAATLMFQWLFSIAFFFPEYTGLIITLASILSFIALIKATATVDWEHKW